MTESSPPATLAELVHTLLEGPRPLPIVTAGNPILRRRALPYDGELDGELITELIAAMRECMHDAPGVGLAAPQIGLPLQLAVLEDPAVISAETAQLRQRFPLAFRVIVNPEYRQIGEERAVFFEGCLSVPGYQAVVDRPASVALDFHDENGNAVSEQFDGWAARIVQHETDHLGGTLYLDKAFTRSLTDNDYYVGLWGGLPVDVAREELKF